MGLRIRYLAPVDGHLEVLPEARALEDEIEIRRLAIGSHPFGSATIALQEFTDARDQKILRPAGEHFAVQLLLGGASGNHLSDGKLAEEIAHYLIVPFAVHTLVHGLGGQQPKSPIENLPRLTMD